MNNTGTLIIAPIRPWSDEDTFPTAYANEIKGGFHSVTGLTDLDLIPVERLEQGMLVNVIEEDKIYKLNGTTWIELQFSDTGLTTYMTTLDTGLTMLDAVGGIPAGTNVADLSGRTFTYLFDNLLFPTLPPILTNPSKTFNFNVGSLHEIGSVINPQFTSTFNRGSIYNGTVFQNYRSGLPSSYNYTGVGLNSVSKITLSDVQIVSNYTVLSGSQSWTCSVSYSEGPQPLDNKANPSGTPLPAGTTSISTLSLEGVYPLYGTTSSISNPDTKQTLVSMLTGNNIVFTMVSESGGNKQSFDIPVDWTTNRPLSNVQTFNTVSNQWETTGLSQWTTSSVTHSSINYTRYTYNALDRGAVSIRLVF